MYRVNICKKLYLLVCICIWICGCCLEWCEIGGIFIRIYLLMYLLLIISNKFIMKKFSCYDDNVKFDWDYLFIDFYFVNNWLNFFGFGDVGEVFDGLVGLFF